MGTLVVSLDFELRWGVLDIVKENIQSYQENLISVHDNVPWMLKIFEERNIAATWATVGALGCDSWEEFDRVKPIAQPSYANKEMKYDNNFNRVIDPNGKLYFAPHLIRNILETPKQELGIHTFGHIYGTEPNVTYPELKEDLLTCIEFFFDKFGYQAESLVFPRNQVIYELQLLQENVIACYRGNEEVRYLSTQNQKEQKFFNRVKIFLDAINPYITHPFEMDEVIKGNVPSSAMLRIYLPTILRKIHLEKLKRNISNLKENEVYHIWFHPHNLGNSQKKKDDFVRFFDFVAKEIEQGKLLSENMNSLSLKVKN